MKYLLKYGLASNKLTCSLTNVGPGPYLMFGIPEELSFNRIKFLLILPVITGLTWKQFKSDWGSLELWSSLSQKVEISRCGGVEGSDRFLSVSMMRYEYRNQISNLVTVPSGKYAFSTWQIKLEEENKIYDIQPGKEILYILKITLSKIIGLGNSPVWVWSPALPFPSYLTLGNHRISLRFIFLICEMRKKICTNFIGLL